MGGDCYGTFGSLARGLLCTFGYGTSFPGKLSGFGGRAGRVRYRVSAGGGRGYLYLGLWHIRLMLAGYREFVLWPFVRRWGLRSLWDLFCMLSCCWQFVVSFCCTGFLCMSG